MTTLRSLGPPLLFALALSLAAGEAHAAKVAIGDKVADFRLEDPAGKSHSLYRFAGKNAVVLMVIATRCPYSKAFDRVISTLPKKYRGKRVKFLGINANVTEPAAEVARHAKENGFAFPVLKDPGQRVVDRLGAQVTPEIFVIDRKRRLVYHGAIGNSRKPTRSAAAASDGDLSAALTAHLAGRKIARPETKAFGCTIKRKR